MVELDSARLAQEAFVRGVEAEGRGELRVAMAEYKAAIGIDPTRIDARVNAGLLERLHGDPAMAAHHLLVALSFAPDHPLVLLNMAEAAGSAGLREDAIWLLQRCVQIAPALSRARDALARWREDDDSFRPRLPDDLVYRFLKALIHAPKAPELWRQYASLCETQGRLAEASDASAALVGINPEDVAEWVRLERLARLLGRRDRAIEALKKLTSLLPENSVAWNNLGAAHLETGAYSEALGPLEQAVRIDASNVMALRNLGFCMQRLGRFDRAREMYDAACALSPDDADLLASSIAIRQFLCDWIGFDVKSAQLRELLENGNAVMGPFALIAIPGIGPHLQLACARRFVERVCPKPSAPSAEPRRRRQGRMRIGFVSGELRAHATGFLIAEVIERFDRSIVETFAFSTSPPETSPTRQRLERSFDHFHDVSKVADEQAAEFIRGLDLDVLIDLNVFTGTMRLGVFSRRPAPIQINYLGYPGTSGAAFYDYIVADETIIPPELERHYAERILRMPSCYQPNDRLRPSPPRPKRAALGLSDDRVVLANMNNVYKLTPQMFDLWCRLLKRHSSSILWTLSNGSAADENLLREAARRAIPHDRIVFAPRTSLEAHMARLACADLMLDTFPCNGHTTTSDALWRGVPVVSLRGQTFASRVAASLLSAVDCAELVADSADEYEAIADALIESPSKLKQLQDKVSLARHTATLFDADLYARDFIAALCNVTKISTH